MLTTDYTRHLMNRADLVELEYTLTEAQSAMAYINSRLGSDDSVFQVINAWVLMLRNCDYKAAQAFGFDTQRIRDEYAFKSRAFGHSGAFYRSVMDQVEEVNAARTPNGQESDRNGA